MMYIDIIKYIISSVCQRQYWIDLSDKTKQELIDRTSDALKQENQQQRLNDSIIQKCSAFLQLNSHEINSNDLSSTKTYSGTLSITIHSIHGLALYNPLRQY
jgi:hypothetical protein